jgi:hypothetical protein
MSDVIFDILKNWMVVNNKHVRYPLDFFILIDFTKPKLLQ